MTLKREFLSSRRQQAELTLKDNIDAAIGNKSPMLSNDLDLLRKDGWSIRETMPGDGNGSYCNKNEKYIVIDAKKDPWSATSSTFHEVGHAKYTAEPAVPMKGLTKDEYVSANRQRLLDDEGAAELYRLDIRDEIWGNGGGSLRTTGNMDIEATHIAARTGKISEEQARREIGNVFSEQFRMSTTGEKYGDGYAKPYEKHFDQNAHRYGGVTDDWDIDTVPRI